MTRSITFTTTVLLGIAFFAGNATAGDKSCHQKLKQANKLVKKLCRKAASHEKCSDAKNKYATIAAQCQVGDLSDLTGVSNKDVQTAKGRVDIGTPDFENSNAEDGGVKLEERACSSDGGCED